VERDVMCARERARDATHGRVVVSSRDGRRWHCWGRRWGAVHWGREGQRCRSRQVRGRHVRIWLKGCVPGLQRRAGRAEGGRGWRGQRGQRLGWLWCGQGGRWVRGGPVERRRGREGERSRDGGNVRFDARNIDAELPVLYLQLHYTSVKHLGDSVGTRPARRELTVAAEEVLLI
jgi:hypothetical protein